MLLFVTTPLVFAPGISKLSRKFNARSALRNGGLIRDEYLWEYPHLNGAVGIYQQMASNREWKVSGPVRGVAKAWEWLHRTENPMIDMPPEVGFDRFLARRSLDHLAVGRKIFHAPKDGRPLRYLDPVNVTYDKNENKWVDTVLGDQYPVDEVIFDHPIPFGVSGAFVSPIMMILPTAMLAWLIREHDRASTDGRKIREVLVVIGRDVAESVRDSIQQMIDLWSGGDPTSNGVPVAYVESSGAEGSIRASDLVTTIGVSRIPDSFDREQFQFEYVNEISAALGLSLRHFWNSERATNRALEEVQQARQMQKGPTVFVRNEQRLINNSGVLKQFGASTRLTFDEEVDAQSRLTDAQVLKLYADSLQILAGVFNSEMNGDSFLAWFQSVGLLPADIELFAETAQIEDSDQEPLPIDGSQDISSDPEIQPKHLDYGEVAMDADGRIVERRNKVYNFNKVLSDIIRQENPELFEPDPEPPTL